MSKSKGYRYIVWAIAVIIYVIVFFHRVALGAVKDDVLTQIGVIGTPYEGSLFSLLTGMYMYAYMLMQIPTGILADTLGPRKTIAMGSGLATIGTIGFVGAQSIYSASLSRLIIGAGVAVVFVCTLKLIATWFPKEQFTVMSGLTSFVGNLGAILAMSPLVWLSGQIGWQKALLSIGVLSGVLAVISWFVIRDVPEGYTEEKASLSMKELIQYLIKVLKDKRLYPVMLAFGLTFGGTMALTGTWGIELMQGMYNVSINEAAQSMSLITLGVAIGSIVIGRVTKSLQSHKIPMVIFAGGHVLCWIIITSGILNWSGVNIVCFLLGMTGTSYIVSWDYAKSKYEPKYSGMVMSVVNFFGFLGGALVPQIIGGIYDLLSGSKGVIRWQIILGVLTVGAIITLIGLTLIKEEKKEVAQQNNKML